MSQPIKLADRVENLPTYIFSKLNIFKEQAKAKGMDLISLAIGDPDQPTPQPIIDKMKQALEKQPNHQYSPYEGTLAIREAFTRFFERRFGVSLDAKKETLALIGSKEGLAHFPLAVCNPGDVCLYPVPGFPMYATTIAMAGGVPVSVPILHENNFLPDLNRLEEQFKKHNPRYLMLNYPHNPTSATMPMQTLKEIVGLALKHNVILVYDNAYSEIYFDESQKPLSILQIPEAKDIAIEFHSMSKTYNMTGWRLAFAVGNETLVQGLLKVKTNIDSGPLPTVQETCVWALDNSESLTKPIRELYAARREFLMKELKRLDIEFFPPPATFYLWAQVPGRRPSMDFVTGLIERHGLVLTPGIGFGQEAEYFFRIAMTVDQKKMQEAVSRLNEYLKTF